MSADHVEKAQWEVGDDASFIVFDGSDLDIAVDRAATVSRDRLDRGRAR